jgi:flagellar basal body rod protein FlgG
MSAFWKTVRESTNRDHNPGQVSVDKNGNLYNQSGVPITDGDGHHLNTSDDNFSYDKFSRTEHD